jgi:hypothetical protein
MLEENPLPPPQTCGTEVKQNTTILKTPQQPAISGSTLLSQGLWSTALVGYIAIGALQQSYDGHVIREREAKIKALEKALCDDAVENNAARMVDVSGVGLRQEAMCQRALAIAQGLDRDRENIRGRCISVMTQEQLIQEIDLIAADLQTVKDSCKSKH